MLLLQHVSASEGHHQATVNLSKYKGQARPRKSTHKVRQRERRSTEIA
jgi:hypothetical protein